MFFSRNIFSDDGSSTPDEAAWQSVQVCLLNDGNIFIYICKTDIVLCVASWKVYLSHDVELRDQFKSYNLLAIKHSSVKLLHSADSWGSRFNILASLEGSSIFQLIYFYIFLSHWSLFAVKSGLIMIIVVIAWSTYEIAGLFSC